MRLHQEIAPRQSHPSPARGMEMWGMRPRVDRVGVAVMDAMPIVRSYQAIGHVGNLSWPDFSQRPFLHPKLSGEARLNRGGHFEGEE